MTHRYGQAGYLRTVVFDVVKHDAQITHGSYGMMGDAQMWEHCRASLRKPSIQHALPPMMLLALQQQAKRASEQGIQGSTQGIMLLGYPEFGLEHQVHRASLSPRSVQPTRAAPIHPIAASS